MKNLFKSVSCGNPAKNFIYMGGETMGGNENVSTETNAVDYSQPTKEHVHLVDGNDTDVDEDFLSEYDNMGQKESKEGEPLYLKNVNKIKNLLLDYSEIDGGGRIASQSYIDKKDGMKLEFNLYQEEGKEILKIVNGTQSTFEIKGEKAFYNGEEITTKQEEFGFNNNMKAALESLKTHLKGSENKEEIYGENDLKEIREFVFNKGTEAGEYEYVDTSGQKIKVNFNKHDGVNISVDNKNEYSMRIPENVEDGVLVFKNGNKVNRYQGFDLLHSLKNDLIKQK